MRTGTVGYLDLAREDARLQAGYHLSEDQIAVARLKRLHSQSESLADLSTGRGVFTGAIFTRIYAVGPDHGRPYVPPGDLLKVTVQPTAWLSPLVGEQRMQDLELREGTVLITCSGMNLGKAIWCRRDMDGLTASHDLIRVEVDATKVPPGYVYAFLACRYGHAWIRKQIYGGNIKHVEANHLKVLPVPRLAPALERQVGDLIRSHGEKVALYNEKMDAATERLLESASLGDIDTLSWNAHSRRRGWVVDGIGTETIRAINHDPLAAEVVARIRARHHAPLGKLCEPSLFKGKIIFRRVDAQPPHSVMLLGQRNAFRLRPYGRLIARSSIVGLGLQVPAGTTLIPSHGTMGEGELYCRALIVTERMAETFAYSGDFFRCVPLVDEVPPGYLFAFLRSDLAFRLLRSISAGGKQQEQHPRLMWRLPVPRLNSDDEAEIDAHVMDACRLLDEALEEEERARALVERAIEEAA